MGYLASLSKTVRADRREVRIAATLRSTAGPQDIGLVDLSVTGFRAKLAAPLEVGAAITVGTRSLGVREAVVAWANGSLCGVEFVVPLTPQQVRQAREIDTVVTASFDADGQRTGAEEGERQAWTPETGTTPEQRFSIPTRVAAIIGLSALGWASIAAVALTIRAIFF